MIIESISNTTLEGLFKEEWQRIETLNHTLEEHLYKIKILEQKNRK
jgi:hypothetical protein